MEKLCRFWRVTMTVAPSTAVFNPTVAANGIVIAPGGPAAVVLPPGTVALGASSTMDWTVGFGGEWAFAHDPVSLSLEYDYLGFRRAQVSFTSAIVPGQVFPINISQKIHTVLFGINYHFVGGGGD